MQLSRVVAARLTTAALLLFLSCDATAQNAPKLSKAQRALLEAIVAAVDQAQASGVAAPATWQSHVLRASDGSHYVAWSAFAPDVAPPQDAALLYVRLATHDPDGSVRAAPDRSAVSEWLQGLRGDPLPMRANGSMTVPQGEMPVGGAASLAGRPGSSNAGAMDASIALRLQDRDRERADRERANRDAQRRAAAESAGRASLPPVHPFEDFDLQSRLTAAAGGLVVERSLTAGPGDYDVYVAWAEPGPGNRRPTVRVLAHRLTLPAASATEFALSDIVLADAVSARAEPYKITQQGAHPYAIGALEATPARDHTFRVDEALSMVFQVINPAGTGTGTPDVEVGFRVTRVVDVREQLVGSLPAQRYNKATLPSDFDVAKGHPLFAAVQAPLRSFARGRYRVTITALDHLSGRRVSRDVRFDVAGTPESLLREAPAPGQIFRRDAVLAPATLTALARALTPPSPSPALEQALAAAAAGRFPAVVQTNLTELAERPAGLALRGLALYGLGDSARAVAAQLQQATAQGAPAAPVQLLLGATYAIDGDDRSAIAAWNLAREGGIDDASVATLLMDAYLRQGDVARAGAMARAALDSQPGNGAAARGLAATYIATARYADALALLEPRAAESAPDPETDFLVLHALYASHVSGHAPGNTPSGRARFAVAARAYTDAGGRHGDLVRAWLDVVTGASRR